MKNKLFLLGGGAAGIFAAIRAKTVHPEWDVIVLEKTAVLLSKVRVSGGGRCNVTHACFEPHLLIKNYPRGGKELLGPFHRFQPKDTEAWFASRGVLLKKEADGRMFPITDSSETIIQTLLFEAKKVGVEIRLRQKIQAIVKQENGDFLVTFKEGEVEKADRLIFATGSNSEGLDLVQRLGHTLQEPVPSLFTFNIPTSPLKDLSGISLEDVEVSLPGSSLAQRGALLITHFGFSGPAILKLSAWGARFLYDKDYRTEVFVNWLPEEKTEGTYNKLLHFKSSFPQKNLLAENLFKMPRNLWKLFIGERLNKRMSEVSFKDLHLLSKRLHMDSYKIEGKTTHKEEFVTCGGVTLKEVNFKTMESRLCPGLFFCGEILDIDGVTGGFNFQNAWTTAFIAASN